MADIFAQEIYTDKNDNTSIAIPYTKQQLVDSIFHTRQINSYYAAQKPENWIWLQTRETDFIGEQWLPCKSEKYNKFEASNYGRVRYKDNPEQFLRQHDTKKDGTAYSVDELMTLLQTNPDTSDIGWLKIQDYDYDVYTIIADAWLVKHPDEECHHISNDGYDNSPYNLIYLPHDDHNPFCENSVHKLAFAKKTETLTKAYPGPKSAQQREYTMLKICQSCAMPMNEESVYGTNKDSSKNEDYCIYCYKNGEFLQNATMDEYIEMMVPFAQQANMTGEQMREYCKKVYPNLKRWKK